MSSGAATEPSATEACDVVSATPNARARVSSDASRWTSICPPVSATA
jgi:hypothetical protein